MHEAIFTTRAMRRLSSDPVSEEDLRYVVEAATMAPNGENQQRWSFLIVTEPSLRSRLGEIVAAIGRQVIDSRLDSGELDPEAERVYRHASALAENFARVPALILVCVEAPAPEHPVAAATYWGSIFPAVQNLLLAARSRGLGTTLTTLHKIRDAEVKKLLGVPDEVETIALIPIGRPLGRWGRPKRRPAGEVTRWDRW